MLKKIIEDFVTAFFSDIDEPMTDLEVFKMLGGIAGLYGVIALMVTGAERLAVIL